MPILKTKALKCELGRLRLDWRCQFFLTSGNYFSFSIKLSQILKKKYWTFLKSAMMSEGDAWHLISTSCKHMTTTWSSACTTSLDNHPGFNLRGSPSPAFWVKTFTRNCFHQPKNVPAFGLTNWAHTQKGFKIKIPKAWRPAELLSRSDKMEMEVAH